MRKDKSPLVTVVMPVYNAGPYLKEAMESVLSQTFEDFEFLAIDDGSGDRSLEVLRACRDPRLRVIARPHEGIVATMNAALREAGGEFIARTDADDLMLPGRLERQVRFLEKAPRVSILGGAVRRGEAILRYPAASSEIRWKALYQNPFGNPSLMFRREDALSVGGYPGQYYYLDDYPFVSRMIDRFEGANLRDVLVVQRVHPSSISSRVPGPQRSEGDMVRRENMGRLHGEGESVDSLFFLLTGEAPPPGGLSPGLVRPLLTGFFRDFRKRYAVEAVEWRRLRPFIGREIFSRSLLHGSRAPETGLRMLQVSLSLYPALLVRPSFYRGVMKHFVLSGIGT